MKSKLIRLFAVLASVLVLAVSLVVPMSADSFDSSKPLIESDWEYVTVIEWNDLERLSSGISDITLNYNDDCYVIFSINHNRYSILCELVYSNINQLNFVALDDVNVSEYPAIVYYYANRHIYLMISDSYALVNRVFPAVDQFSITIYHNSPTGVISTYDENYVSVTNNPVEPSSTRITSVFTDIMDWITSGLNSVQGVFYANNQLTMLGTLAVIGVAIAVAFLLIGVLQRFLHLRG